MIRPFPKLARTKLADWGLGVTVCIAAFSSQGQSTDEGHSIITVCDRKVALATISADDALDKIDPIHHHWAAMTAGDDITHAIPIWDKIRQLLGYEHRSEQKAPEKSLAEVSQACAVAFQEHRRRILENTYLSSYGLDMPKFLKEGRRLFGTVLFSQMCSQISAHEILCEFLVAGFDAKGYPHIFTVEDPGVARVYDSMNFWAIGSGQQLALSALMSSGYLAEDWDFDIYDVCAAKFMAEKEPHVGESTFLLIHRFGEKSAYMIEEDILRIKYVWESHGLPRRPPAAIELIKKIPLLNVDEGPTVAEIKQSASQNAKRKP